jgi:hypothetical protein
VIRERLLGILVGAAMLLAACGGGGPPTAAPGQTAGSETTAGETTSEETTAETTDGETSEETAAGGGGGTADACALVTIDEVAAATGYGNIEAQPILHEDTMGLSGCGFVSDGLISAAIITILDPENTNTDPTGYLAFPGAEEVPVSGARAIWMPGAGYVMMVIKDGRVASVQATPKEGEFGDAARKLAQPVADRL